MKTLSLYWIVCAVSLGGLLFGFDSGVISGCEEAIQGEFSLSPFWHGLVVAGALIGTVFGALAAGKMCDLLGRKPTLVWMGILFFISAAGCALTPGGEVLGPQVLGWMRFIGGIGIGGVSVAVPMYIAEIAPPGSRGRLVLVNQFCIVLGIVVSYISNYCVARWLPASPGVVWRAMLGAECLPIILYLMTMCFSTLLDQQALGEYFNEIVEEFGVVSRLMPAILFLFSTLVTVLLGSSWAMYAIALPAAMHISAAMGLNLPLCVGAVAAAGIAGEKNCVFTSDSMSVGNAIGCDPKAVLGVRLPYSIALTILSLILYVIAGFLF